MQRTQAYGAFHSHGDDPTARATDTRGAEEAAAAGERKAQGGPWAGGLCFPIFSLTWETFAEIVDMRVRAGA